MGLDRKSQIRVSFEVGWIDKRLLILGTCLTLVVFSSLACSLPGMGEDSSLEETRIALDVQATTLAMQAERLTQQAGSPSDEATTPPEPPTEAAPPTEPPPLPPTPTETHVPTEEPTVDTQAPVEGSLVRAPYDPADGWGTGHDYETFDGSSGKFPASTAGAAVSWYDDGRYHISFTSRGRWTWYWTFLNASDFYADVVVINGDKCVDGDSAGLIFRGDQVQDWGLMFGISCGGDYFIGITAVSGAGGPVCSFDGANFDCVNRKFTFSDLIDTGPGAINRIGVKADGYDFDFYINGHWVDDISAWALAPFMERGNLALYLGTAQKPDARVSFEDFSIWYLP